MELGSQTGSVINNLMSRGVIGQPKPKVGMGVTILMWTDRVAGTIVNVEEVISKRWLYLIEVQQDRSKVVAGSSFDGSAEYAYEANASAPIEPFGFDRKLQRWTEIRRNEAGRVVKVDGRGLRIGEREEYRDPSF